MSDFKPILENHLKVLTEYGSGGALAIKGCEDMESILKLNSLEKVDIPDDLITYFQTIDGYDPIKEYEFEELPLDIACGMAPVDLKLCYSFTLDDAGFNGDDDTYWPDGFVPILYDYGGNYILVNCIKESPTYGAVYDFTEGVGVNLLSHNLCHFFDCATREITTGFRVFKHGNEDYKTQSMEVKGFDEMEQIYGNTPFFQRRGKMDTQIIDWI